MKKFSNDVITSGSYQGLSGGVSGSGIVRWLESDGNNVVIIYVVWDWIGDMFLV